MRTVGWLTSLFVSRLHTRGGPLARSAGLPVGVCAQGVCAQSAGRHRPLFASPRGTLCKPLQLTPFAIGSRKFFGRMSMRAYAVRQRDESQRGYDKPMLFVGETPLCP